jgi:hypothetical protein
MIRVSIASRKSRWVEKGNSERTILLALLVDHEDFALDVELGVTGDVSSEVLRAVAVEDDEG